MSQATIYTITLESRQIEGIPVLAAIPASQSPCPVVFYTCGFWGNKTRGLSLAYLLARQGIACLSFDPIYHGDRYDPRVERAADPAFGGIYPPETGLDTTLLFFEVIRQCVLDIRTLLAAYESDPRLDTGRAGVTGFSLGAYVSFLAMAEIPRLQAAVPMMGVPTFGRRWQDLLDECALSEAGWARALAQVEAQTRQHTTFIRSLDPGERLKQAAPRALLVMAGDFDHDQPKHYSRDWVKETQAAYAANPERLQLKIYPLGHTVTPSMEQDAVEWFHRYLKPEPSA